MVRLFFPEAEQDAAEAYGWYEERQPGLGEEFLRALTPAARTIRRNPEMHGLSMKATVGLFGEPCSLERGRAASNYGVQTDVCYARAADARR
jgi:hypothetical protein